MNHGFEAHVHLPTADDFSHIGRVIGFQEGDFNALVCEVTLCLRKVERGVVGRCVPCSNSIQFSFYLSIDAHTHTSIHWKRRDSYQLVRNVIFSVAMMNVSKSQTARLYQHTSEGRQSCKVRKGNGEMERGRMSATHVLSLELSRSSSGSIISEQPGGIHPS